MDWQNWCRLCGCVETLSKIEEAVIEIAKKLEIGTNEMRICVDCNNYLIDLHHYTQRSKTIELMFLELEDENLQQTEISNFDYEYEKNINSIRDRFGLKVFVEKESGMENFFEETAGALEIKVENDNEISSLTVTDALEDEEGVEEREFIEETIDDDNYIEGSEIDTDNLASEYNEEDQDYQSNEEEDDDEDYITEEMNQRARKIKKEHKNNSDESLFDFICHICKEEFPKMTTLTNHCHTIHDCLPEVQCFCGKTISSSKRLKVHSRKHFPEKYEYECSKCKMAYKLKSSYINHIKTKHGPDAKTFVCSQCARCFKDSRTLIAHEKTHLPAEMKLLHTCEICNKKFVNKNSLKSHITSIHEMLNLFTCETCGKTFTTKSNLKSHLYSHSNEKNVQCDICSACFKNMDSLRKHKKTHLEKSFECNICHNRYRNRNNLKAHMVCHSEDKPYSCTFCPNTYKRSKDLKCHLNLHTGERPHTCQFCSRTFINGSNCRKHKLKDHPEELAAFESIHGKGKAAAYALNVMKQS